jgi:hypothetical protein
MVPWDELDFLERNPWAYRLSYYQRLLWERKLQLRHGLNYLIARLLLAQYKVTTMELRELLSTGEGVEKLKKELEKRDYIIKGMEERMGRIEKDLKVLKRAADLEKLKADIVEMVLARKVEE